MSTSIKSNWVTFKNSMGSTITVKNDGSKAIYRNSSTIVMGLKINGNIISRGLGKTANDAMNNAKPYLGLMVKMDTITRKMQECADLHEVSYDNIPYNPVLVREVVAFSEYEGVTSDGQQFYSIMTPHGFITRYEKVRWFARKLAREDVNRLYELPNFIRPYVVSQGASFIWKKVS